MAKKGLEYYGGKVTTIKYDQDFKGKYLKFNYTFLTGNIKNCGTEFLTYTNKTSKLKIKDLLSARKETSGYECENTKEHYGSDITVSSEYLKHIEQPQKSQKLKKITSIRVGKNERIFGDLNGNIFYALKFKKDGHKKKK